MNNTYTKHIASFFIIIVSSLSWAGDTGCSQKIYQIVGTNLGIDDFDSPDNGGSVVSEYCKVWPYKKNITLAVLAYSPNAGNTDLDSRKEVVVAMIDNVKNIIISSDKQTIEEDAITEIGRDSFTIDTARYQLSEKTRAFGVRFYSTARGPSCGEAAWNNELTLYSPEGKKLNRVLSVNMSQQRLFSGCIGSATGHDSWEYAALSIAIEKSKSHNFNDIKVIAHIKPDTNMEIPPSGMNMKPRDEIYLLRYNGKHYENSNKTPPWWMGYY